MVRASIFLAAAALAVSACGVIGGGAAPCATSTRCVDTTDCSSGQRCNTALSPPSCQGLYCGGEQTLCSEGFFCETRRCVSQRCAVAGAARFGAVTPVTSDYLTLPDGGPGSVWFSDDARNDCAAVNARQEYGALAGMTIHLGPAVLADGLVVPWVTDADVRAGRVPATYVAFSKESLTGIALHSRSGTLGVVHAPTPADRKFAFSLTDADGGVDGTYSTSPLCP